MLQGQSPLRATKCWLPCFGSQPETDLSMRRGGLASKAVRRRPQVGRLIGLFLWSPEAVLGAVKMVSSLNFL